MRFSLPVVTAAFAVSLVSTVLAGSVQVTTRFGALTVETIAGRVNFQGRVLYEGRPLHPDVRGNNALYVAQKFQLAGSDAVLFRDAGGTACPDLWYFVSVSPFGRSLNARVRKLRQLGGSEAKRSDDRRAHARLSRSVRTRGCTCQCLEADARIHLPRRRRHGERKSRSLRRPM